MTRYTCSNRPAACTNDRHASSATAWQQTAPPLSASVQTMIRVAEEKRRRLTSTTLGTSHDRSVYCSSLRFVCSSSASHPRRTHSGLRGKGLHSRDSAAPPMHSTAPTLSPKVRARQSRISCCRSAAALPRRVRTCSSIGATTLKKSCSSRVCASAKLTPMTSGTPAVCSRLAATRAPYSRNTMATAGARAESAALATAATRSSSVVACGVLGASQP